MEIRNSFLCWNSFKILGAISPLQQNEPSLSTGGSAIAITLRSVAKVTSNYICGSVSPISINCTNSFNGISCMDSDMAAKHNLILNCSSRQLQRANNTPNSLNGIVVDNNARDSSSTTISPGAGVSIFHTQK